MIIRLIRNLDNSSDSTTDGKVIFAELDNNQVWRKVEPPANYDGPLEDGQFWPEYDE